MTGRREDKLVPWIYLFFRVICRWGFKLKCGLTVTGHEHIPSKGGVIIASNHASYLDPPIIGVAVPQRFVRFMARDTLFEKKLLGWLYHRFGVVPLSREKGDVAAIKVAIQLLKEGNCISLFPEGTRSLDGNLQQAKGGIGFLIYKANVPVVPTLIRGSYEAWPKGRKFKSHPIHIRFGAPIPHDALEFKDERGKPDFHAIGQFIMQKIAELDPKTASPPSQPVDNHGNGVIET